MTAKATARYSARTNIAGNSHVGAVRGLSAVEAVIYTNNPAVNARSVFTDFGPITRPALTLEEGTGLTFVSATTVTLLGASIPSSYSGYELVLSGTSGNDGTYLILSVKSQTTVLVVASFNLPDADALTASWTVVDPRDGEIADDPAHVTVTVNGNPVVPEAVVGLMGQVVLPFEPAHGDSVQIGYSWVSNPTVEVVRLNSKEFRLNEWNRDTGLIPAVRHYRYNNVLPITTNFTTPPPVQQGSHGAVVPFEFNQFSVPDGNVLTGYAGLTFVITAGLNIGAYDIVSVLDPHTIGISPPLPYPTDPLSGQIPWTIGDTGAIATILPQPLLRDMKYRAYERAYTALLNDPNTLTLNAPSNLIAYPPLARTVAQTFVSYESSVLPENDPTAPWLRNGTGSDTIVNLQLVVVSPTAGDYPAGTPIYWSQTVDQTFPHIFASTWDMQINATPTTQGVFTGVAFGYSDSERAIVVGYLLVGATAQIGFMVQGGGNDPSVIGAWTGGLTSAGQPTNAPATVDWTMLHSYRIYEDSSGNVSLYLDGSVIPFLSVTEEQLPFLEELASPFNTLQGVFWGHLSSQAACTSTWDFVRYLVLPLNPLQTAPSIFVDYSGNVIPEVAAKPWTPVGYHGVETILGGAFLLLDSVSAVPATEETATGLVGGDYRGYFRLEPLIASSAEVVVDFDVQVRTWTQGFSPNALMVAVDDNDRLIQLSFVSDTPAPKFSYAGDGLPTSYSPPWTALGTGTALMFGRTLQIVDPVVGDGLVYVIDDTAPVGAGISTWLQSGSITAVGDSSMTAVATIHPAFEVRVTVIADSSMTAREVVAWEANASISADSTMYATPQTYVPSPGRVISPGNGYILEARLQPLTWTVDGAGNVGAQAEVYDSKRTLGFSLMVVSGVPQVALQGEGTVVARFAFDWNDGEPHTYRVVYSPAEVVTLFVDGLLLGTPQNYGSFPEPLSPNPIGFVSFGSSAMTISTVNWIYCNAWRVEVPQTFVGIWRGTTTGSLLDYWVPTKATGSSVLVVGNALMDTSTDFVAAGVQVGDYIIIDAGLNMGVYPLASVAVNTLTLFVPWPASPSRVSYRIAQQTDWTQQHAYRIVKAPSGDEVAVFLDSSLTPLVLLTYDDTILPPSQAGLPRLISGAIPSVVWGAFDPTNLSQSSWQYLRYGVTRSPTELRIVPPHQVLNQRNLIASFERHLTNLPHTLTDFWSGSEGIPPNTDPDFLANPNLTAFTLLNEGTPLVPQTQTYEVQVPTPSIEYLSALNNIADVLNSDGSFLLNDATTRVALIVPNDVLYSSLQIIERDTGTTGLIAPFDDAFPEFGAFNYQDRVCLEYDAETLPENDPTAITPWTFVAQDASHVTRSVFGGILTYGTDGVGTQTLYRNATPLTDAPSLGAQAKFRLKVVEDSTGGLGDSQIRFGFSAPGLTASLALVSAPTGIRYVLVIDQLTNQVLGGIQFDFLDSQFHTYRLVRNPNAGFVQVFVDS